MSNRLNQRLSVACISFVIGLMIYVAWGKQGLPATEFFLGVGCGLSIARRFMRDELALIEEGTK